MRGPIKPKERDKRRYYKYLKSMERATPVVNMGIGVYIEWRENKTSTVCTAKNMNTSLYNVTQIISLGKNVCTVTRRATNEKSSAIHNNMINKEKGKRLMSLEIYITTSSFLAMTHSRAKIKLTTRELRIFL